MLQTDDWYKYDLSFIVLRCKDALSRALQYYYPWLRPVPIQHTSQLSMEHTMHAAIIGAKR